jgi:hypothetical protein
MACRPHTGKISFLPRVSAGERWGGLVAAVDRRKSATLRGIAWPPLTSRRAARRRPRASRRESPPASSSGPRRRFVQYSPTIEIGLPTSATAEHTAPFRAALNLGGGVCVSHDGRLHHREHADVHPKIPLGPRRCRHRRRRGTDGVQRLAYHGCRSRHRCNRGRLTGSSRSNLCAGYPPSVVPASCHRCR